MKCLRSFSFAAAAALALAIPLAGCDDTSYNHRPPPGQGSVFLDNITGDDIHVYLDGAAAGLLNDYETLAIDAAPGIHRLVLDANGSDRYAAWDIDVIEGRLTVVEVRVSDWDWETYAANIHLETP